MSAETDKKTSGSFWSACSPFVIHILLIMVLAALSVWLGNTAKTTVAFAEKLAEQEKALMAKLTEVAKITSEAKATAQTLETSAQKAVAAGLDLREIMVRLEGGAENFGQSALVAEAIAAAEDAEKRGDMNLAVTFMVNALQRQPANIESTKRYVDLVIKTKDADLIAGAQRLLEQLLFQARPADVTKVAAFLGQIVEASDKAPRPSAPEPEVALNQRLEEILATPMGHEADKLTDRLESLLGVREEFEEGEHLEADKVKKLAEGIEITQACLKGLQILDAAKVRVDNVVEAERQLRGLNDEKSRVYALASLQAAELVINEIWMVKHRLLPPAIAAQIQELPAKLKEIATEVQDEVEKVHVASAKQLWTDVWAKLSVSSSDLCADRLKSCGKAMVDCTDLASKTQGAKAKMEFRLLLKEIADKMESLRKNQFAAYQSWAVAETEKSRAWFLTNWVKVEHHVDDALKKSEMQKIDFQLLAPEVAQFVQDVLGLMLKECGDAKKADVQRTFTVGSAKKKLEDF